LGTSDEPKSTRIQGGSVSKYVIVQHKIENDKNGVPKIKEVLLAHPDTEQNVKKRLFKWRTILEMENLRIRDAQPEDYPKKRKKKK
jgi:esterase/lipase superfamily enzyme